MFMSISPKIFHKNKYGFERHNDHFNNQCYLYTIAWRLNILSNRVFKKFQ